MNSIKLWRQGDILIQKIEKIPAEAVPHKGKMLAEGSATGKRHKFSQRAKVKLFKSKSTRQPEGMFELFAEVKSDSEEILHPEHGTITLETGFYRIWPQREYTPNQVRAVFD